MSIFDKITSFQNTKVKQVKKLRERRARDKGRLFVIDDVRDLERALDCGYLVDYVFYCPALAAQNEPILQRLADFPIYDVPQDIMEKVSYRENPSPILAVMQQKPVRSVDQLQDKSHTQLLALVNLQKPGNIGALLRTADATGFKAIILIDTALDIYNPNIIRSSTGACFLDNIYTLTTSQAVTYFKESGYQIIAAAVDGDVELVDADLTQKTVIVLGTEDQGLDVTWLQAADQRVRIPMIGTIADSLNVSVSGAMFMYEALRQHRT